MLYRLGPIDIFGFFPGVVVFVARFTPHVQAGVGEVLGVPDFVGRRHVFGWVFVLVRGREKSRPP